MTRSRCGPALLALLLCCLHAPGWSEPPAAKKTDRFGDALPPGAVARMGSVRLRAAHRDDVTCLAFAPDGKTLISGSKDKTLRVWDAATGELKRVYDQHRAAIMCVAIAPDGKSVASGDADNAVHLWNPANGKLLHRFAAAPGEEKLWGTDIRCLAFAADGKTLFAGRWMVKLLSAGMKTSGRLSAWDVATGQSRRPDKEEDRYPVALTADGRYLASAAMDITNKFELRETLFLRPRESSKVLGRIDAGKGNTFPEVIFSRDGRMVAANVLEPHGGPFGSSKTRGQLWETATGKSIAPLEKTSSELAFSPDGKFLAVARPHTRVLCLLSTITGRVAAERTSHPGGIACCTFSPDGRQLATGGVNGTIHIWDVSDFKVDRTLDRIESTRQHAEKQWEELSDADAARAYRAVGALTVMPEQSLPLLRERLKPVADSPATLKQAIQDLDSAEFAVRERAHSTLEKANELARPPLVQALKAKPSLELRRRAEALLDGIDAVPLSADRLRLLRALAVLERIATAEATQILTRLAEGAPGAFATLEAKAALERLNRRRVGDP